MMKFYARRYSMAFCQSIRRLAILVILLAITVLPARPIQANNFITADISCDGLSTLPQEEYNALGAFYNQMDGPHWANRTNWGSLTEPADTWYGVTCSDGHITGLHLDSNNLSGTLVGSTLAKLIRLQELSLNDENGITGPIPAELGGLLELRSLSFGDTSLSGPIPSELHKLTKLENLLIGDAGITGEIPHWINDLTQLQQLHLFYMPMSGAIPEEICQLTNLTWLRIFGMDLTGTIPSCLGNLSQLQSVDFSWAHLTGSIPELSGLKDLITLDLEQNFLEGNVPDSITQLTHLTRSDPRCYGFCETNLNYNMLTASGTVKAFLNNIDPNWANTQTVPPDGLGATSGSPNSVTLTWTPLNYNYPSGYYEVYYAAHLGGPWTRYNRTVNKNTPSMTVENLLSGVPYYFKIRTFTEALYPEWDSSTWTSKFSDPVTATTLAGGDQQDIDPEDTQPIVLQHDDGGGVETTITIPPGSASQPVTLAYAPLTQMVGFNFTDKLFTLTAFQDNMPLGGYVFNLPVTIHAEYTLEDLNGIPEDQLVIMLYDTDQRTWRDAASTCTPASTYVRNSVEHWIQVDVCHLTRFALSDPKPYPIHLPIVKR